MRIHKGDRWSCCPARTRARRPRWCGPSRAETSVILEGVNVAKRHAKPTRATQQGGIIDKFMPVHVSTVALVCKSCDKPTRVGYKFEDDGEKVRVCKKCGSEL